MRTATVMSEPVLTQPVVIGARRRVVLVGWGAIGQTVADLLSNKAIEIVAVGVLTPASDRADLPAGAMMISDPSELAATKPDIVAEAAGRDAVGPWGRATLSLGADYIVSSMSAFADGSLLQELEAIASTTGAQIHLQPGALGGIDALAAARLMGVDTVEHRIVKPAEAWRDTPAEGLCDLGSIVEATEFFSGTASEAATEFPKNANVAMTTALAGVGPDNTRIVLVADPTTTTNRHEITAVGAFGELSINISNNPLPSNPKTSAMAALNLARAINNCANTIVI